MLDALRVPWSVEATDEPEPFLHPAARRAIAASAARRPAGSARSTRSVAAAVGPRAIRWPRSSSTSTRAVEPARLRRIEDVTSFPEVREDLAVIVADGVSAAEVLAVARAGRRDLLRRAPRCSTSTATPSGSAPGNVSLALRLRFRAADRTLTDEEVAARRRKIAGALADELGGRVRDS